MRFKKFLLLFCGSLLVAGVLAVCLAPLAVAGGLRFWIARTARQEGLRIEFGKIEAPLLRPVVVHKLQIASQADAPFRVMVEASRVELDLNFAAIFNQSRGRFLRSLTVQAIGADIRGNLQPVEDGDRARHIAYTVHGDAVNRAMARSGYELRARVKLTQFPVSLDRDPMFTYESKDAIGTS